jgi:hypothetical protein
MTAYKEQRGQQSCTTLQGKKKTESASIRANQWLNILFFLRDLGVLCG